MKILVVASLLVFGGCATLLPPVDPVQQLRNDINGVLSDSIFVHTLPSIKVVSLNSGQILFDKNSELLMHPASNLKLFTSSAALHIFGQDFQFKTLVLADSQQSDSVVRGNLFLKGYGNPDLKVSDLDSLAARMQTMGIRRIEGDIVADASYFDDLYWGNGWMWDDEPDPDEMFISALSVNKNCVTVTVTPTTAPSDSVIMRINPPTPYVTVECNAKTVDDSTGNSVRISRLFRERLNTITISGNIQMSAASVRRRISVWQPALFTAELFKESLQRDSIVVLGNARLGFAPPSATQLAEHWWSIDSVLIRMNKVSDNLSAENILKTIGATRRGLPGTAQNGIYVENEFLSSLGIDTTKCSLVDGSGVSHYNLLTVDDILRLLVGIARRPDPFHLIYLSLPIAGVDGTLEFRMKGTLAQGNVRGKTGTINGVSSSSGYLTTRDGELLAFSMMMENFIIPTRYVQFAQDRICELLAGFSRSQPISDSR